VRVLVVWEPILVTDWTAPSGSTLARIPDGRVRQFWDPKHVVTQALSEIAKQKAGQPVPDCCVQKGLHWDEAVLYASHSHWKDAPAAVFWNGPVVRAIAGLEKAFNEQQ
jgi:hypothetical protein